jgi:tripartite-type tricarboxylate transporter receptor subunit TctC
MRIPSGRVAACATAMLASIVPAAAQDPAAFYKGRTIDLIVASTPGGGFDAYARIMARHIGKYIPGNPNLVVRNLPGAGGLTSTLYLNDVAPRDGTALLANQPGPLAEPVLGDKSKAKFDPLIQGYVGSVASFTTLCLIRQDSKAKSFEDWQRMEVTFGTDQPSSTMYDHTVLFKNLAGAKTKIVSGYPGSNGLVLALQRGEIEGLCGYAWSSLFARSPELITKNIARMVVQYGLEPHKEATAAGVPQIWKFVKNDEDRQALELIAALQEFGRPYMVGPGVPKDRLEALRKAFDATMKDKEFLADMEKAKLDVIPMTGAKVEELVAKVIKAPKAVHEKAKAALIHKP